MRGTIGLLLALWVMPASPARAQHTKRDAAELSAKLDAILRGAYKKPSPRAHHAPLVDGSAVKKPDPPPPPPTPVESAPVDADAGSLAGVMVHALRIAFDPDEWPLHLRALPRTPADVEAHLARLPKTPDEVAAHLRNLPKTPEEVAAHLRNLPKTPAEMNAHLRRLDASLQQHRQQ